MNKGLLKNLTCVFRRYENPFVSLNRRFVILDNRSDEFIEKYYRVMERSAIEDLKHLR